MKYTYFSTEKGGKYLIRQQFILNRRSTASINHSKPLYSETTTPIANIIEPKTKQKWYWCDSKTGELRTHENIICFEDKMISSHYQEQWFPIPDERGHYSIVDWGKYKIAPYHDNFWQCLDDIFDKSLITNPLRMMGFCGPLSRDKRVSEMQSYTQKLRGIPLEYVLERLRERKNIIAYKEDIRHLAKNWFSNPHAFDWDITNTINKIRKLQDIIPKVLDHYNIPFEMFSLDSGDYGKEFNLDKTLPRDCTDNIFSDPSNVDYLVDKYMDMYP